MLIAWSCAAVLACTSPPGASGAARAESIVVVGVAADDAPFSDPALDAILDAGFVGTSNTAQVRPLEPGADLLAHMEWARQAASDGVRAVYWIEPVDDQRHRLYLFDPRTDQVWVRSLPQGNDASDVLETLGAMVRSLTEGLPEGTPRGMEPVAVPDAAHEVVPAPAASDPPPSPPATRFRLTLGVAYVGVVFDRRAPWQSGAGLDVDGEFPIAVFVRVGAAAVQPVHLSDPGVDVWHVPIGLEVGYRFRRDRAVRPELGVGLGVDPIVWRGREAAGRSGTSTRVGVGPTAGLRARLWRGLGLHVRVHADVWLHNVTLVADAADGRATALRPLPVAAVTRAGIDWRF